jgi:cellulose synthase/poly-beta-1,6-N-acetylglucosamine synthase-like glycosyltransferase
MAYRVRDRAWPAELAAGGNANASWCAETYCLRGRLDADVIAAAEHRAARVGVGADRVLIAAGTLNEESYLRCLGQTLGLVFEPLDDVARAQSPVDDEQLVKAAAVGVLPLVSNDEIVLAVAPRATAARQISRLISDNPELKRRFRLTSAERLNRFVFRLGTQHIGARATERLQATWPMLSAAPRTHRGRVASVTAMTIFALLIFAMVPAWSLLISQVLLTSVFLAWLALRLIGAFIRVPKRDPVIALRDDELPVYTIIVALYREAASVDGLIGALESLKYPPEKLDVKIVTEADDYETHAAIAARKCRIPIEVITAPAIGPRTKPKALNVALPFARGTFTVIYDAEDRPEPDQLRRALQTFRAGGNDLACVQAALSIDNTKDGWLARIFTAEYAGQFDVFLPGIAALHLPLPLGGSSNHFRTATLHKLCGWDPYNVTEDADLGMRLARFGYRADIIDSTTYEEAPARLGPWLRQRTRWFKGWAQTWLVHMREPRRLLHDLGPSGFLAFQLIVGGNVLAALVHPLFMGGLIYSLASGEPMWQGTDTQDVVLAVFYGTSIVIGYFTSVFLGWIGLARRGLSSSAWVLLATPVHWLLLSLAAWRALYQLVVAPYAWEKTEHGLAKNSRRADKLIRSLLELERYFDALKKTGELPTIADNVTNISAAHRPRLAASA